MEVGDDRSNDVPHSQPDEVADEGREKDAHEARVSIRNTSQSSGREHGLLVGGAGLFPFFPKHILPTMRGQIGFSVGRTLVATTLFAVTLGLMRVVPSMVVGAIAIPMWCAAVGVLVDGQRGAMRGVVLSVVYPIYCSILLAIAFLVFWVYALLHTAIASDEILW